MMMIANATNVVMQLNHAREITDKNQAIDDLNIVSDMAIIQKVPNAIIFYRGRISKRVYCGSSPEKAAGGHNRAFRTFES